MRVAFSAWLKVKRWIRRGKGDARTRGISSSPGEKEEAQITKLSLPVKSRTESLSVKKATYRSIRGKRKRGAFWEDLTRAVRTKPPKKKKFGKLLVKDPAGKKEERTCA